MPMLTLETFRSGDVAYRITFERMSVDDADVLGAKIADIMRDFAAQEIRLSCEGSWVSVVAFVLVPADVTIEAIDRKAEGLQARWKAEER